MPSLLVGYGWRKSMTFLCVNVNHGRLIRILHALENLDEFFDVVTLFQVLVFKAPRLEPVVLAGAVALTQGTQVLIDSAMIFGDRHFVVVYHDDDARAEFRSLVQSLESLAARKGAVADNGDDVLIGSLDVARLLQTGGKTHGSRSMPHLEVIIFRTFGRRRIARNGIHVIHIAEESRSSSGEHLMRIALVAYVKHELILWRIKNVVKRHGSLHESQVRPHMTAMLAHTVQHSLSGFISHHLQFLQIQLLQVGWRLYFLNIHIFYTYSYDYMMIIISGCKDTKNPGNTHYPNYRKNE